MPNILGQVISLQAHTRMIAQATSIKKRPVKQFACESVFLSQPVICQHSGFVSHPHHHH